jgi:hypothetical protein
MSRFKTVIQLLSDQDLELKSEFKGAQGLKEALRRRELFHKTNQKLLKLLAFESKGMSCIIGKGWTCGFKISSRMTFDQPFTGRAFS